MIIPNLLSLLKVSGLLIVELALLKIQIWHFFAADPLSGEETTSCI